MYIVSPIVSNMDVVKADLLFLKFGRDVQQLYGNSSITPNMHFHCHLKECVMDFGPTHVFWCISFERFNGILGATKLNGLSIEIQLMRKLLAGRFVSTVQLPKEFDDNFIPFFDDPSKTVIENFNAQNATKLFRSATCYNMEEIHWSDQTLIHLPNCYKLI